MRWPASLRCGAGLTQGRLPEPRVEGDKRVTAIRLERAQVLGAAELAVSCGPTWNDVARLGNGDFALPEAIAAAAAEAGRGAADVAAKVDWATRWIGAKGPHAGALRSRRALSEVVAAAVASAEEQSRYFVALLRAMGVSAVQARVGGEHPMLDAVPRDDPGDRYVVFLPDAKQWLEMSHAPRPLCGRALVGERALLLAGDTTTLRTTEGGDASRSTWTIDAVARFAAPEHPAGTLELTISATGCLADFAAEASLAVDAKRALGGEVQHLDSSVDELGAKTFHLTLKSPSVLLGDWNGFVPVNYWPAGAQAWSQRPCFRERC